MDVFCTHMRRAIARTVAGQDHIETLRGKGVSVPAKTADIRGIAGIGLPACVAWVGKDGAEARVVVARYGDVAPAIARAMRSGGAVRIAQCVTGHEVACGVMADGKKALPLVPVDLIPRSRHEAVPHLTERQIERVQQLAKEAHVALGASAHSCMRCVVAGHEAYVIAVDLSPALSPESAFMQGAAIAGVTRADLRSGRKPKLL